ncbi:hypothetical protein A2982_01230 [candidate division WWE3 bacterium RIFCSPLOWO2_01_FULL_39_13]|uniref:Putative gluconeogenesis factor n=1 Tax=candidate division WWE3 bacterium RIFCSPLOWO2_01_FULL_39_13 TaxID=1802624 RepID=A0A1F4V4D2_UNCKA|nr:MAG: hypothetical protein A2982_01230 [candidate division WWE3 bacterium RIFCSPLOWO2_01_FULL_39_13]
MKNVVVIGGGTGTYTVLSGIKNIPGIAITAIVASTDSGGSTGILRDEYGQLPVGDLRQCLVALTPGPDESNILRKLFNYRFTKGDGLSGHSFGNLFLTALREVVKDDEEAILQATKILNIKGQVIPITYDKVQLVAEYSDGTISYGESMIDDPPKGHDCKTKITRMWTQPNSKISARAKQALDGADYIIIGPGDLYTSTLANFVVEGACLAVSRSKAKVIYIVNVVSKYGETHGFMASNYIDEIEKYILRRVDYVMLNSKSVNDEILRGYAKERAYPVEDDLQNDMRVIRRNLISGKIVKRRKGDKVKRSLLRHDITKLRKVIEEIITEKLTTNLGG